MGCGCGSNKKCGGKVNKLRSLYNRLTTLYNTITDNVLRQEYKSVKDEISVQLKQSASACPSDTTLSALQQYVDNEYRKRSK